ncbi:MAG: hypothetical protein JXP48_05160 [Acidobacteria bacterium]|nr:hypothetical protein [Acidobacteriota bacterium]
MTQSDPEKHRRRLEALGRISPAVAHDINNLLSGIMGYSQMAQGDPGKEELNLCLEEIEKAGRRIASLARILQTWSPRAPDQPGTVDLNAVIADLEKYLRLLVGPETRFRFTPTADLPPARADSTLLRRALLGLAVDAASLQLEGGALSLETRPAAGARVLLLATLSGTPAPDPGALVSDDIGEIVETYGGEMELAPREGPTALHLYLPAATR